MQFIIVGHVDCMFFPVNLNTKYMFSRDRIDYLAPGLFSFVISFCIVLCKANCSFYMSAIVYNLARAFSFTNISLNISLKHNITFQKTFMKWNTCGSIDKGIYHILVWFGLIHYSAFSAAKAM